MSLGDVAKVSDSFATQQNVVRINGQRASYMSILKNSDASTIAVVKAIRDILPEVQAQAPEGLELKLDFDQSVFVQGAVDNIVHEADPVLDPGLADDPDLPRAAGGTP